jgi:hypothetical protein
MTVAAGGKTRAAGYYGIIVWGGGAGVPLVNGSDEPPLPVRTSRRRDGAGRRGGLRKLACGTANGRKSARKGAQSAARVVRTCCEPSRDAGTDLSDARRVRCSGVGER